MSQTVSKSLFTTYDIAKLLRTTDTSVKRWINKGQLEAFKTPGGHRRITRPALERFVKENNYPDLEDVSVTKKILIVDDEEEVRDMIGSILTMYNPDFIIRKASDGFKAGKLIAQFRPDIVLLDLMMPGIDGFSVCQDIKSSPDTHHIPVLVVTGYATDENVERIKKCGADAVLPKPVRPRQLFDEIVKLL